jgi:hypothetical protein
MSVKKFGKKSTVKPKQGDSEEGRRKPLSLFAKGWSPVLFWLAIFVCLFLYLQKKGAYHFYYIEQEQLFLYNAFYLRTVLALPAGLARLLAEFGVQYFVYPYCGALVMSALFTLIGIQTAGILKRTAPQKNLFLCSLLPVILLLFMHFNVNYKYTGTVAYCMMLTALYFYFRISGKAVRLVYSLIAAVLLFWWAGAVAMVFAVCILLWELLNRPLGAYGYVFPLLLVILLALWSVHASLEGDYRFVFLPDGYYSRALQPDRVIYLSWICLPLLLLLSFFLRKRKGISSIRKFIERAIQFAGIGVIFVYGMKSLVNYNAVFYEELDHYMRTAQWDKITVRCKGNLKNYLYKCCLNVALAEKGELAERMFSFDQQGLKSLYLEVNKTVQIYVLLSDTYFATGHIALSQQMAFEANVSTGRTGVNNPRMLKRLIQTNLIYGAYPVAEKYISLLEQTACYREWAQAQRRFLWNDAAVESDSLLGIKRKCIPLENQLSQLNGLDTDLKHIAEQNPAHTASIQYAGAAYLLIKDMALFQELVETYHGAAVLPVLPESFQEAVIILSEQDPASWERYHIPDATVQRFAAFRKQVIDNKGNPSLSELLMRSYGDTYWFYYMFKKTD